MGATLVASGNLEQITCFVNTAKFQATEEALLSGRLVLL